MERGTHPLEDSCDGLVLIALRNAKLSQVSDSIFRPVQLGSVHKFASVHEVSKLTVAVGGPPHCYGNSHAVRRNSTFCRVR